MSLTLPGIRNFSSLADVNPYVLRTAYETLLQPCVTLSPIFEKQKEEKKNICAAILLRHFKML